MMFLNNQILTNTITIIVVIINLQRYIVCCNAQPVVLCTTDEDDETFLKCNDVNQENINEIQNKIIYKKLYIESEPLVRVDALDFPNLEHLSIEKCRQFEILENNALVNLTKLKTLSIQFTNLKMLKRRALFNLEKLQTLKISHYYVNKIESGAFNSLIELTHLDFSGNQLQRLPNGLLDSLSRLKWLSFYQNKIETIPEDFFFKVIHLEYVDFSANKLQQIPEFIFKTQHLAQITIRNRVVYDSNVKTIDFSYNSIKSLHTNSLSLLLKVETIGLRQCGLRNISRDAFTTVKNLLKLDLTSNGLTNDDLNKVNFRNLKKLRELDLSNNKLESFNSAAFAKSNLIILNLPINEIREISPAMFNYTTKLQNIVLSINKLTRLNSTSFQNLKDLRELRLNSNQIEYIEVGTFSPLSNLIYLDLSGNKLTSILPGTFDVFYLNDLDTTSRILNLVLRFNQIADISKAIFKPLKYTTILDLSTNKIQTLPEDVFETMTQLKELDLSNNLIETLPTNIFVPVRHTLTNLIIKFNKIKSIDGSTFSNLLQLTNLELTKNELESFDEYIFNLPNLKSLKLNMNKIRYLSKDALHGDSVLEELSIYGNRFIYLDDEFFENTHLQRFKYENNPWICQCLDDMFAAMKRNGIERTDHQYDRGTAPACVIGPNRTVCVKDLTLNDQIYKDYKYALSQYNFQCTYADYC